MRSRRSRATALLAMALVAAACTEGAGPVDAPADDADDRPTAEPRNDTSEPASDEGVVIDDECFGDIDRCGTILRPAGDASAGMVAIYFTVAGADEEERPLLVLRSPAIGPGLGEAFADRPVVTIETRGGWRSPPEVDCPEVQRATSDEEAATAWATCRSRIVAGGFDVAATDLASVASDVIAVADALGFDEVDMVASGFAAPAALYAATLAPELTRRMVLYRPVDPLVNAVAQRHTNIEAALRAVWSACEADDGCAEAVGVDAFLDLVAALDDSPIELPPRNSRVDGATVSLDSRGLLGLLEYELGSAVGARTVVDVPGWLIAGSVDQLGRLYDDVPPARSSAIDLTWICGTLDQPYDAPSHPLVGDLIRSSITRVGEICDRWTVERPATVSFDADAVEVMTVVSAGDPLSPGDRADGPLFGEVVVIPSLGAPPPECLVAAAERWFREAAVTDDLACTRPSGFRAANGSIELVETSYTADWFEGEITLLAPAGWGDGTFGRWARDRDTFDPTSLEVWLYEATTLDEVESWLPGDAEIVVDGPAEARVTDRAKWRVVRGSSTWADDERVVVGIGRFGDAVVEVVVRGVASEMGALTSTVFGPVLESVDYSD